MNVVGKFVVCVDDMMPQVSHLVACSLLNGDVNTSMMTVTRGSWKRWTLHWWEGSANSRPSVSAV
jgi:hypothetical protein